MCSCLATSKADELANLLSYARRTIYQSCGAILYASDSMLMACPQHAGCLPINDRRYARSRLPIDCGRSCFEYKNTDTYPLEWLMKSLPCLVIWHSVALAAILERGFTVIVV